MPMLEERFWAKVDKNGPVPGADTLAAGKGPCWLWTASKTRRGYGQVSIGRKLRSVHQVAWELLVGPPPVGLELDHLCHIRHCVNPDHLEWVTHRENLMRSDNLVAQNARKTHCVNGHEFTPENTRTDSRGNRGCWICIRRRRNEYKRKVRSLSNA